MYLDGQLPYGPASRNPGAPPIPAIVEAAAPKSFLVPGGGPTVVSPTVADDNGIVQYPINEPITDQFRRPDSDTAQYSDCGDYAASGVLPTIRDRAGRGIGLAGCQSGPQSANTLAADPKRGLLLFAGLAAIVALLPGGRGAR